MRLLSGVSLLPLSTTLMAHQEFVRVEQCELNVEQAAGAIRDGLQVTRDEC